MLVVVWLCVSMVGIMLFLCVCMLVGLVLFVVCWVVVCSFSGGLGWWMVRVSVVKLVMMMVVGLLVIS